MKPGKVNIVWEIDTYTPSCANLATREEPYLSIIDMSQKYWLTDREVTEGIRSEDWVLEVVEEDLYERLIANLAESNVPEYLWPDANRLELVWRFGKDQWSGPWVEVELREKK